MSRRLASAALLLMAATLPLCAAAQQGAATPPASGNPVAPPTAPATPTVQQNRAPSAPGVNTAVRPQQNADGADAKVIEPGDTDRSNHCSEARFPNDPSPPCVIRAPTPGGSPVVEPSP